MDLHLDAITLVYPDGDSTLTAVEDLDLSIPSGTTTALLGPSGSGKSSLLAVAGGLTRPTAGTVRIEPDAPPSPPDLTAEVECPGSHEGGPETTLSERSAAHRQRKRERASRACGAPTLTIPMTAWPGPAGSWPVPTPSRSAEDGPRQRHGITSILARHACFSDAPGGHKDEQ